MADTAPPPVTDAELRAARTAYRQAAQALPISDTSPDLCLWKALRAAAKARQAKETT